MLALQYCTLFVKKLIRYVITKYKVSKRSFYVMNVYTLPKTKYLSSNNCMNKVH